tara:strand:+ start:423 stop:2057 length:1635 start_codon:yes stop_codon:yes gene_type:complete
VDIIEHYIKNSSLVEIPTDFKKLVVEGKTDSDKLENAICMAYNIKHNGWTEETGPGLAKAAGWNWLKPKDQASIDIGTAIVDGGLGLQNLGTLVQSGSGGGGKSNYTQGGDTTPKTDLYGGAYHISLKEGNAQLASSKAGETKGVMEAAIKIAQNMGTKVSDDIKDAIDNIVGKGMSSQQDNKVFVQISPSKKAFSDWYITDKNKVRWDAVKKEAKSIGIKSPSDKQIQAHLKKELANAGATTKPKKGTENTGQISVGKGNDKKYVGFADSNLIDRILDTWTLQPDRIKAAGGKGNQGVIVSKKHIDKRRRVDGDEITNAMLTQESLSEKVRWLISSSMKQSKWETELNASLAKNDDLKTAIVYEAASGHFKFTGEIPKEKKSYTGGESAERSVANYMMKVSGTSVSGEDMWSWCEKNKNLAQNVNISFKGSGTDYYAKFGLRTILGESNKQESFEDRLGLNEIISKEYKILQTQLGDGNLTEGIIDFIKKTATKVKTYVADFFKRVIQAIVNKLKEWANAGLETFAKLLGWELDADCSIGRMP